MYWFLLGSRTRSLLVFSLLRLDASPARLFWSVLIRMSNLNLNSHHLLLKSERKYKVADRSVFLKPDQRFKSGAHWNWSLSLSLRPELSSQTPFYPKLSLTVELTLSFYISRWCSVCLCCVVKSYWSSLNLGLGNCTYSLLKSCLKTLLLSLSLLLAAALVCFQNYCLNEYTLLLVFDSTEP